MEASDSVTEKEINLEDDLLMIENDALVEVVIP